MHLQSLTMMIITNPPTFHSPPQKKQPPLFPEIYISGQGGILRWGKGGEGICGVNTFIAKKHACKDAKKEGFFLLLTAV